MLSRPRTKDRRVCSSYRCRVTYARYFSMLEMAVHSSTDSSGHFYLTVMGDLAQEILVKQVSPVPASTF
jgi:hypothetical protein